MVVAVVVRPGWLCGVRAALQHALTFFPSHRHPSSVVVLLLSLSLFSFSETLINGGSGFGPGSPAVNDSAPSSAGLGFTQVPCKNVVEGCSHVSTNVPECA
jgi:hypothetical protein